MRKKSPYVLLFIISSWLLLSPPLGYGLEHPETEIPPEKLWNPARCADITAGPAEIKTILTKSLKTLLHTTKRKVYFYHYGWRTKRYPKGVPEGVYDDSLAVPSTDNPQDFAGPVSTNPIVTTEKNQKMGLAEYYFRTKAAGHLEGPMDGQEFSHGLYTATDPLASISYSGNSDLLLRVGVPAGVNYIDLRATHRTIPLDEKEFLKVQCYLRSLEDKKGKKAFDERLIMYQKSRRASFWDPKSFLEQETAKKLIAEVYKELNVGFLAGGYGLPQYEGSHLNPESQFLTDAIFIKPDLAPRLDLDLMVPALEKNPSPEKLKVYADTLRFFDAYNFNGKYGESLQKADSKDVKKFWLYYGGWAPVVYSLPPDTDLKKFQAEQSKKYTPTALKALCSELFGCSTDPELRDEIPPSR